MDLRNSEQILRVFFSTFCRQFFFECFSIRIEKLHRIAFIIFFLFFLKKLKKQANTQIFILSVIQRGALKSHCLQHWAQIYIALLQREYQPIVKFYMYYKGAVPHPQMMIILEFCGFWQAQPLLLFAANLCTMWWKYF